MVECMLHLWEHRFHKEKQKNIHNDERMVDRALFQLMKWVVQCSQFFNVTEGSWLWNLGSVSRWTQYQSFPHDHTMSSCCWESLHLIGLFSYIPPITPIWCHQTTTSSENWKIFGRQMVSKWERVESNSVEMVPDGGHTILHRWSEQIAFTLPKIYR